MLTKKALILHIWLFSLVCISIKSHSQNTTTRDNIDPGVDSLVASPSILEKINQLVVIRVNESVTDSIDQLTKYGAVLTEFEGLSRHIRFIGELGARGFESPLVLTRMRDGMIGIDIDSVDQLCSELTFSAVSEPHVMYETGKALAEQCSLLGVDGLIPGTVQIVSESIAEKDWRLSELNQGLSDHGSLPIGQFNVIEYDSTALSQILGQDSLSLILLNESDITGFEDYINSIAAIDSFDFARLDGKVQQMLALKSSRPTDTTELPDHRSIVARMNAPSYELLKEELTASSITLLKNESELLPISSLERKRIASLTIGKAGNEVFNDILDNYTAIDHYQISYDDTNQDFADLWTKLNSYDLIICALYESEFLSSRLINAQAYMVFQGLLNQSKKTIVAYFGNPRSLEYNNQILNNSTVILSYEDNYLSNLLMPQAIFGARDIGGVLPVTINESNKAAAGQRVEQLGRFMYSSPAYVGLDAIKLQKIDSLVEAAIRERAIPGCQILVARNSCVVYKKSFGFHTYDSLREVTNEDLYDLASITKVSGALPALMKLYEEGKFNVDTTMGTYLRYFKRGNKKDLKYREILAHQAGLTPWIPYWQTTMKKSGKYRRKTLSPTASDDFPYEITDKIYVYKDYKEKIYKQIKKSKIGEKKYLYSGLTFYLYPDIIEAITGEDYQDYIRRNFYDPLGATTLTYNPLDRFQLDQIVETEYDSVFRKTQIHGRVHDEGAAMMHGVSSNAGLFANANDLAKLFQMYCNYGTFGGKKYLNSSTVLEFTRWQFPENNNRRALGFDRPLLKPHENGNTAKSVSQISFGHTGFTGTFAWADPYYNLVYIFLSNRVYPTRKNTKLYDMNIRTNIQEAIYEAMTD